MSTSDVNSAPIGADSATFSSRALNFLAAMSVGYRCAKEAVRLQALSDEQLKRLGISRDEVVDHAFRDRMAF